MGHCWHQRVSNRLSAAPLLTLDMGRHPRTIPAVCGEESENGRVLAPGCVSWMLLVAVDIVDRWCTWPRVHRHCGEWSWELGVGSWEFSDPIKSGLPISILEIQITRPKIENHNSQKVAEHFVISIFKSQLQLAQLGKLPTPNSRLLTHSPQLPSVA
jgi:hypothetical protein